MTVVFGVLSFLCLVYYGVIVLYAGAGTSFSIIWVILAAVLAVMSLVMRYYPLIRERIPLRLEVSVVTIVAALFTVFVFIEVLMGFHIISLQKHSADYVVVLGSQVNGKTINKTLQYRLDRAFEYSKVHPNTVFVLSGGQCPGEDVSEASLMYNYLKEKGVPEHQMMREERSTNTYENLIYSKSMIDNREVNRRAWIKNLMAQSGYLVPPDEEVTIRVGIITSNFHVFRAKSIAKEIGIQNVTGIAAKTDPVLFLHFCVRECFAILKDSFVGNM